MQVSDVAGGLLTCRDRAGRSVPIDGRLIAAVTPGTWVMTFAGAACAVLTAQAARQGLDALAALEALGAGETPDLDALFADLTGREPQLPDFLRAANKKDSL